MRQENPGVLGPLEVRQVIPFEAAASSDLLGWVGLEAARYREAPTSEINLSPLTHHTLVLITRPPEQLELRYEGVKRHIAPPAGAISVVPAGAAALWRWSGQKDSLHIYLEPDLIARVAVEAFDLDPARLTVPPLDGLDLPHLRAALLAVDAELTTGGLGGRLAAESLASVLAVHLIRHVLAPRQPERGRDGTLPQGRLRAVVEYIEEHLEGSPTLEEIAAVVLLSSGTVLRVAVDELKAPPDLLPAASPVTLADAEREHILSALREANQVLGGPNGAAIRLGMKRSTLHWTIKKLNISRPG